MVLLMVLLLLLLTVRAKESAVRFIWRRTTRALLLVLLLVLPGHVSCSDQNESEEALWMAMGRSEELWEKHLASRS
jgi:glucan phosphoethanolaminetransferase (alkaline phosphatase superfamily)